MKVLRVIKREEGFRAEPYYCSNGFPTIGFGKRIGPKGADLSLYQFTVTEELAAFWVEEEVNVLIPILTDAIPCFATLSEDRQAIVVSMAYQMGVRGLLGFSNMLKFLEVGYYLGVKTEALDSVWARKDSPLRARRHAEVLYHGSISKVYGDK